MEALQLKGVKHRANIVGTYLGDVLAFVGHLYCEFMEKICLKAPSNYSASFWISSCSISLFENPHPPIISMISGFFSVSLSPHSRKNKSCLERIVLTIQTVENSKARNLE